MVKTNVKCNLSKQQKKSRIVGQSLEIKISENQFICLNLIYFNIFYYILIYFNIISIKFDIQLRKIAIK